MAKKYQKPVILLVLVALVVAARYTGLGEYLTFESLKKNKDILRDFVAKNYIGSVLGFIGAYILTVALSIPGATVLTLAGGFLFGALKGVVYVNIGATGGAVLAFLASRYLLGGWVQSRYTEQLKKFNTELEKNGANYLLTLRLIPIFPFFLINFLSGLTRIGLGTFIWTTALGIIPGSAVYCYAGKQLGSINSLRDIASRETLLAFALLGLLALVPVVYKKVKGTRGKEGKTKQERPESP